MANALATKPIFPTTGAYQLSTQYFDSGCTSQALLVSRQLVPAGLTLGQIRMLFDGSMVQLLMANAAISANQALTAVAGTPYTVVKTAASANQPVVAVNDRSGSTAQAQYYGFWGTVKGIASPNLAGSLTAPLMLANDPGTAGQLYAAIAGTTIQGNLVLIDTTTGAAAGFIKML